MCLKHLARNTDNICVLNRIMQIIWHYRTIEGQQIFHDFRVESIRPQIFPSLPFASAIPKAIIFVGNFSSSFLSSLLSSLFFDFFPPTNREVIKAVENEEGFKQNVRLEGFMGFKYKKGEH